MKTISSCLLLLFTLSLFSQEKGVTPLTTQNSSLTTSVTRAVVIGISDYQNEDIPDLRFADKDAEAFAKYLQSNAGGKLPDENIKLLTNKNATMAAVASELDWLVEESTEGDKAIIYFSGHGDVEAKTARQPGFLLTYDSPPKIYIAGAYPLFYLQLIVETLSSDKNVQTLIITDACRAGKLAGSEIGGTQATAANLAKQYANEIKILSCQPDEFSLEGEQWGGGRGVFSYHLIEGMVGLADKNGNGNVNLLELENYLEAVVPEETDPQSQIPMTVGSKGTKVADVDAGILAKLKDLKSKQLPTLAAIESRGFEETLLANVDSSIQIKYDAFIVALEDKNLIGTQDGQPSADDLYRQLIKEESLTDLYRFMTRKLATALQDDAQQAINAYLLGNPSELEKRWKGDKEYAQYPRYLGRAAELLGESHYMHNYLIAKKLYFEGLNLRLAASKSKNRDSIYQIALEKQKTALKLENRAAYFYNEIGVLHTQLKLDAKAFEYYDKAIALAPEWGLPYANYAVGLYYTGDIEKAVEYGEKAGSLLGDFPQIYSFLAWVYANNYGWRDKQYWNRTGTELQDNYSYELDHLSNTAQIRQRLGKSIELLKKAVALDPNYTGAFYNLGFLHDQIEKYEEAIFYYKKVTALDSLNSQAFGWIGGCYSVLDNKPEAEKNFLKALSLDSTASNLYNNLGLVYGSWGKPDKAIKAFKKSLSINTSRNSYSNIAYQYTKKNIRQPAENYYLRSNLFNIKNFNHPGSYKGTGDFYKDYLKRYNVAADLYQMALELKPDYVNALKNLAEVYITMEQPEKVPPIIEKLEKLAANNVYLFFDIAYIHFQLGDKEKAIEVLQKQVANHANDPDIMETAAWRYQYDFGAYREAEDLFLRALELKGDSSVIYAGLGFTYLRDGQTKKSFEYFQKMLKKDSSAWYHYSFMTYYAYLGQNEEALKRLEETFKKGFSDVEELQFDKDMTKLRETPEFDHLVRKYFPEFYTDGGQLKIIETNTYDLENCVLLGRVYEKKEMWEKATAMYEKAVELKSDNLSNEQKLALAEAYLKLGQHEAAQSICPEAISSDDPEEYFAAANMYYHLQKPEEAKSHFEKYTTLHPGNLSDYYIGKFYNIQGEFELAIFHLNKCPVNARVYMSLILTYFYNNRPEAALRLIDDSIKNSRRDITNYMLKALLLYYQDPQAAKAEFEITETFVPGFIKIWEGLELMRNNRFEEADAAWLELQPKFNVSLLALVKYKYLQMKIRQGKTEEALHIFEELIRKASYSYLKSDAALDPIRELPEFKKLMHWYFSGKVNH